MPRIWITGAFGQVGSYLARTLNRAAATGREIDIADEAQISSFIKSHGPFTHIVNCAAYSTVDPAETSREESLRANAVGPEVLGKMAKRFGIRVLHFSTDFVFSGLGNQPWKETDPTDPCNYYAYTKLEGEKRLLAALPEATILRISSVYGIGGKNFVAKLLEMLQTKEELRIVDDQVNRPTYVPDLAPVVLRLLDHSGIYHFANAGPTTKYEFTKAMKQEAERLGFPIRCRNVIPCTTQEFPSLAKRPAYSAFDTAKIEAALRLQPRHWKETLNEYLTLCKTS